MSAGQAPLLELEGVHKTFAEVVALDEVYLKVRARVITGLVGPSGAGKTTLLKVCQQLLKPQAGRVYFRGQKVAASPRAALAVRRQMAMVQQKPVVFGTSVAENVALGLRYRGVGGGEAAARVAAALELVELTPARERQAPKLSGGQAQRVAFARAVVVKPRVLLLDEFTANLDPRQVAILERAVKAYIEERPGERAALVVTHNLFQARRLTQRLAVMIEGRIVEQGPTEQLFLKAQEAQARAFLEGEMVW